MVIFTRRLMTTTSSAHEDPCVEFYGRSFKVLFCVSQGYLVRLPPPFLYETRLQKVANEGRLKDESQIRGGQGAAYGFVPAFVTYDKIKRQDSVSKPGKGAVAAKWATKCPWTPTPCPSMTSCAPSQRKRTKKRITDPILRHGHSIQSNKQHHAHRSNLHPHTNWTQNRSILSYTFTRERTNYIMTRKFKLKRPTKPWHTLHNSPNSYMPPQQAHAHRVVSQILSQITKIAALTLVT